MDESFFSNPKLDWQRQYEALRAYLLERLPAAEVARRLGYEVAYVRQLAHRFRRGTLPWQQPGWEPPRVEARSDEAVQERIRRLREQNLSAEEIADRLAGEGVSLSSRTVRRILDKAGYPRLARRSRGERNRAKLAALPAGLNVMASSAAELRLEEEPLATNYAGLLFCLPVLRDMDLGGLARQAGWPVIGGWAPGQCLDALLLAKLAGWGGAFYGTADERGRLLYLLSGTAGAVDPAVLSRYAMDRDDEAIRRLQSLLARRRRELGIGDERALSIGRRRMAGLSRNDLERNSGMGGVMTSVILVRALRGRHLLLDAWPEDGPEDGMDMPARLLADMRKPQDGQPRLLVCGARMLSYGDLAALDRAGVLFITHRRRGELWLDGLDRSGKRRKVSIPGQLVAVRGELIDAPVRLRPFERELRQIVFHPAERAVHGRESLTLLTNMPLAESEGGAIGALGAIAEEIVRDYLSHERLQRRMPGDSGLFGCKGQDKGQELQDDGAADTSGFGYLHPRLGIRAWPAPLELDLLLTQAAEIAAELLSRRLCGSAEVGSPRMIDVDIQRPGVLRRDAGCLKLSTMDLGLYQTLQRWGRAGEFAGCVSLPEGGLKVELVDSMGK